MAELKAGDPAPDFETVDETGEKVSLKDLRGKRVVLYFYPKDNTTGCTAQACAFRDTFPQIESKNAVVLGVSPDTAKSHQGFKSKYGLPFPLLLDPDHKIAQAYDVWREKSMYGRKYMGMLRSHFVIDEQGKIIDVQYNVKASDSASRALKSLA
jgi:thioredoxin-dependent peroxiredoxin